MSELLFVVDSGVSLSKMRELSRLSEIDSHSRPMFEVCGMAPSRLGREEWTIFRVRSIFPAIDGNHQSVYAEVFVLYPKTEFLPAGTLQTVRFNYPVDEEGSITAYLIVDEVKKPVLV